jgi:hypothetical protein
MPPVPIPVGSGFTWDLVDAAKLRDADVLRLARKLYAIKAKAYRDTLLEAQRRHGGARSRVVLSQEIRDAIREEADLHARYSVQTMNRMIERWAQRNSHLDRRTFANELGRFLRERGKTRSQVVSGMAPLTAKLDAEVAFYRENGIEPEFDFAGPPAKCELCRVLKATGPHSIERVLEVGYPHLNCTHRWRSRSRATAAMREGGIRPGQISAGRGAPAGILGSRAMIDRLGNLDVAIASLTGEG